jgi:hypothetical protein
VGSGARGPGGPHLRESWEGVKRCEGKENRSEKKEVYHQGKHRQPCSLTDSQRHGDKALHDARLVLPINGAALHHLNLLTGAGDDLKSVERWCEERKVGSGSRKRRTEMRRKKCILSCTHALDDLSHTFPHSSPHPSHTFWTCSSGTMCTDAWSFLSSALRLLWTFSTVIPPAGEAEKPRTYG